MTPSSTVFGFFFNSAQLSIVCTNSNFNPLGTSHTNFVAVVVFLSLSVYLLSHLTSLPRTFPSSSWLHGEQTRRGGSWWAQTGFFKQLDLPAQKCSWIRGWRCALVNNASHGTDTQLCASRTQHLQWCMVDNELNYSSVWEGNCIFSMQKKTTFHWNISGLCVCYTLRDSQNSRKRSACIRAKSQNIKRICANSCRKALWN